MQTVRQAGFAEVQIVARHLLTPEELEAMACCPGEEFTPPPGSSGFGVGGSCPLLVPMAPEPAGLSWMVFPATKAVKDRAAGRRPCP